LKFMNQQGYIPVSQTHFWSVRTAFEELCEARESRVRYLKEGLIGRTG